MSSLIVLHGCCTIQLTKGQNTLVDEQDWLELNRHSWNATWDPCGQRFYAQRTINGPWIRGIGRQVGNRTVRINREIKAVSDGELPKHAKVDHKNMDSLDNRRENLRVATQIENKRNGSLQRNSSSGFKGVHWHKRDKKWMASIRINRKLKHLGQFCSPEEAAKAYNVAAIDAFGEFARLNNV